MSLVAYDSSDDSSDGEQISSITTKTDAKTSSTTLKNIEPQQHNETQGSEVLLFTQLPKPKTRVVEDLIEEDVVPLRKKHQMNPLKKDGGPVKIMLPSLSEVIK